MIRYTSITLMFLILFACGSEDDLAQGYISASACSKKLSSGEIVDCETDKTSEDRLTKSLNYYMSLDKTHPAPTGPDVKNLEGSESYWVKQVDEDNILHIENGEKIFLAGLECGNDNDFRRYLNGMFIGKYKNRISYRLTGFEEDGVKYAYIWEIGSEFDSLSHTNETVISSLWCDPIEQVGHQFHSRYKLIAEYAKENAH